MGAHPTLSACMIVKNEGHQLAEALTSLQGCVDEIVVVDTGSDDNTASIARQFTSRVFEFPWCDDFAAARNVSLQKASGDYFFWMDADDRLDSINREYLRLLKKHFDGENAFYFTLQDVDKNGPGFAFYQIRCAPRKADVQFHGRIHEYLSVDGLRLVKTNIVVHHYGYQDPAVFLRKMQRNVRLLELELKEGRDDEHLYFYLALSYDHLGESKKAIEAMEKAATRIELKIRETSTDLNSPVPISNFLPEAYLFLAESCISVGETDKALRWAIKAQATVCEDPQIYFRLACIHQELDRHSPALHCLYKALEVKEESGFIPRKKLSRGEILVRMAFSFLCLNQQHKALECLMEARKEGSSVAESWEQIGFMALKSHHLAAAYQAYETAADAGELSPDGYCNLGLLCSKKGATEKAIVCYETALQKDPSHQSALANLGHLNIKLGLWHKAKMLFDRLIELGRRDLDILLACAIIAAKDNYRVQLDKLFCLLNPLDRNGSDNRAASQKAFFVELSEKLNAEGKTELSRWAKEISRIISKNPKLSKI